jgi:hypothetical protein
MLVETTAEQLFFVTTRITATGGSNSWVGTGFIYAVATDRGTAHFLVTNKHVLAGASILDITMIAANPDGTANLGHPASVHWTSFEQQRWMGHPNGQVDVAVVPYSAVLNLLGASGHTPFFRSVGSEIALTREKTTQLDALESVVFVGYPNGIYDTASLLPVMRRGNTATPISVDYRGLPAFLVDAAVYPGSSGSPVLLFDRGMYPGRSGTTIGSDRIVLLGVLAAAHTRQVTGEVTELPTRWGVSIYEPMGLGIVYRTEAIDTCIDLQLAETGLHRTQSTVSAISTPAPTAADEALAS